MSSDTRDHDDMNDDDATRPAEKATVPPPADLYDGEDYGDDEATVMARIPDELIAESQRAEEIHGGGLKQMFSRDGGHAPAAPPPKPADEGDALLDMLFDDARDDRRSVVGDVPKPKPITIAQSGNATRKSRSPS